MECFYSCILLDSKHRRKEQSEGPQTCSRTKGDGPAQNKSTTQLDIPIYKVIGTAIITHVDSGKKSHHKDVQTKKRRVFPTKVEAM